MISILFLLFRVSKDMDLREFSKKIDTAAVQTNYIIVNLLFDEKLKRMKS